MSRTTFSFRMDDDLRRALRELSSVMRRSMNQLVNDAVSSYVRQQSAVAERDLQRTLGRIRAYTAEDPSFEAAIERFVDAEASEDDPVEGVVAPMTDARREIRKLLRES